MFLDIETHIKDRIFHTRTYDKREAFNFEIVNYPDLSGNIPEQPAYGVYSSQIIRYARVCSHTKDLRINPNISTNSSYEDQHKSEWVIRFINKS